MKIALTDIGTPKRIRKDLGDLSKLASSIKTKGLINPITVAKLDGKWVLLAGLRRMKAAQSAGLDTIECNIMDFDREIEVDENMHRKDFSRAELRTAVALLWDDEEKKAQERRQLARQREQIGGADSAPPIGREKTRNAVARRIGGISGDTVEKIKAINDSNDPQVQKRADTKSIDSAYKLLKAKQQQKQTPAAASPSKPSTDKADIIVDKTGTQVPAGILEQWRRAEGFAAEVRRMSDLKCLVDDALAEQDPIFVEITNTTVARMIDCYNDLKRVLPYAVCYTCAGHKPQRCTVCKGRGWLSEFLWHSIVPATLRELREARSK